MSQDSSAHSTSTTSLKRRRFLRAVGLVCAAALGFTPLTALTQPANSTEFRAADSQFVLTVADNATTAIGNILSVTTTVSCETLDGCAKPNDEQTWLTLKIKRPDAVPDNSALSLDVPLDFKYEIKDANSDNPTVIFKQIPRYNGEVNLNWKTGANVDPSLAGNGWEGTENIPYTLTHGPSSLNESSGTIATTITGKPNVTLNKSASQPRPSPGQLITYTVKMT